MARLSPRALAVTGIASALLNASQQIGVAFGLALRQRFGVRSADRALAQRFPAIDVDADVLYGEDGNVLTSAGTATGIDAYLYRSDGQYGLDAVRVDACSD